MHGKNLDHSVQKWSSCNLCQGRCNQYNLHKSLQMSSSVYLCGQHVMTYLYLGELCKDENFKGQVKSIFYSSLGLKSWASIFAVVALVLDDCKIV